MNEIDMNNLLLVISIVIIVGIAVTFGVYNQHRDIPKVISNSSENIEENPFLFDYSYSLRDELSQFYNYNISLRNMPYTEDNLKEKGGVCWHYARWYRDKANDMGYYTKTIIIKTNQTESHEFTIVSSEDGYCILDQLNVNCVKLN